MAMGTVAMLWMFPLAEVWGVQPVRVSARLSSNVVSPRVHVFVPVPSAGFPTHSKVFARA
eukprot:8147777-Lingulodinium_polyedra.AAC.1